MPFIAGVPRPIGAGRKKGSTNKPKYVGRVSLSVDVRPVTLSTYSLVDLSPTEPTEEETPTTETEEISTSLDTLLDDPSPIVVDQTLTTKEALSPPQPIDESPTQPTPPIETPPGATPGEIHPPVDRLPNHQRRKPDPTLAQAQPPIEDAIVAPDNINPEMLVRDVMEMWWEVLNDPKSPQSNKIKVGDTIARVLISRQPAPLHDLDLDLKSIELEIKRIELNNKKQQTTEGDDTISFGFLPNS